MLRNLLKLLLSPCQAQQLRSTAVCGIHLVRAITSEEGSSSWTTTSGNPSDKGSHSGSSHSGSSSGGDSGSSGSSSSGISHWDRWLHRSANEANAGQLAGNRGSSAEASAGRHDVWRRSGRDVWRRSSGCTGEGQQQQQQQQQQPTAARDPQQLTGRLRYSSSPQQLLALVQRHGSALNTIHLSAAFSALPRLLQAPAAAAAAASELIDLLEQLLLPQVAQCDERTLANVIWACCRLQRPHTQLVAACLAAFLRLESLQQPQHISNVLWAAASSRSAGVALLAPQDVAALLDALTLPQLLKRADPQALAVCIWSVAALGLAVPEQQQQQLLDAFAGMARQGHAKATPQAVANVVWAVASSGGQLGKEQLQQLVAAFIRRLPEARPQEVSMLLWAMAQLGGSLRTSQMLQLLDAFTSKLDAASEQAVMNVVYACGQLRVLPTQLLTALGDSRQQQQSWARRLPQMTGQALSNLAWALGNLDHQDQQLHALLLQSALQRLPQDEGAAASSSGSGSSGRAHMALNVQGLCTICWSLAVLDLKQHVDELRQLVQACSQQHTWSSMAAEGMRQLHQVHKWLLDCQLPGAEGGLQGLLTPEQLQQCEAASRKQLLEQQQQQLPSTLHRNVFAALKQLRLEWQQAPQMHQLCEPDGCLCIDITATTAAGVRLAIEADGRSHFRQSDRGMTGPTRFRNRMLAARGYALVMVPYFEWHKQQRLKNEKQWLQETIHQALGQ